MSEDWPISILEGKHMICMLIRLLDGPCSKMELYHSVSKNSGMLNQKVDTLSAAGLVNLYAQGGRAVTVSLTEEGRRVAIHLKEANDALSDIARGN